MTDSVDPNLNEMLIDTLTAHQRSLRMAGCDSELLSLYSLLLSKLRQGDLLLKQRDRRVEPKELSFATERNVMPDFASKSLKEIESLADSEQTPRRVLEAIAITRFSVPKGSMRSFVNRAALIDKLRTLIQNEKAHETIGEIARGQGTLGTQNDS